MKIQNKAFLCLLLPFSPDLVSWLMRHLALALAAMLVVGCAGKKKPSAPQYSAPTGHAKITEHVAKATLATTRAKANIATIKATLPNNPTVKELETNLNEAVADLANAQTAIGGYKAEVQVQTTNLNTAVTDKNLALEQADYWHTKHSQAFRKLWFWRSLAIVAFLAMTGYAVARLQLIPV